MIMIKQYSHIVGLRLITYGNCFLNDCYVQTYFSGLWKIRVNAAKLLL